MIVNQSYSPVKDASRRSIKAAIPSWTSLLFMGIKSGSSSSIPSRQTQIRRNFVELFLAVILKKHAEEFMKIRFPGEAIATVGSLWPDRPVWPLGRPGCFGLVPAIENS